MRNNSNIEIVRDIYRNFVAGRIGQMLEAFDEQIDWDGHVDWRGGPGDRPYEGRHIGRDQVAEALRTFTGHVSYERAAGNNEYVASGDSVLVTGRDIRRVVATGELTENRWSMFWTLKDGKVIRFRGHQHTVDVAEPLGTPEENPAPSASS